MLLRWLLLLQLLSLFPTAAVVEWSEREDCPAVGLAKFIRLRAKSWRRCRMCQRPMGKTWILLLAIHIIHLVLSFADQLCISWARGQKSGCVDDTLPAQPHQQAGGFLMSP
jgi:hypothetical protein